MEHRPERSQHDYLLIYADGSINPERSGVGVVALDRRGRLVLVANRLLPCMTNNEAEYYGLLLALEIAAQQGAAQIEVRLDSEIVVGQMTGRFSVNSPKLKRLHQEACAVVMGFQHVKFTHIHRERNAVADALASEAAMGRRWCTFPHHWKGGPSWPSGS